jgi:hypothetical protein
VALESTCFCSTVWRQQHGAPIVETPLACAIEHNHEKTASILSANVKESEVLIDNKDRAHDRYNFLYMIYEARFADLVGKILERGKPKRVDKQSVRTRNSALQGLLVGATGTDEFIERKILEDVYQITMLLLSHGADPDFEVSAQQSRYTSSKTARELGSRCSDPRVRNLLLGVRAVPLAKPVKSSLQVGRLMSRPDGSVCKSYTTLEEESSADEDCSISLWDFVKEPQGKTPITEDGPPDVADTVGDPRRMWRTLTSTWACPTTTRASD